MNTNIKDIIRIFFRPFAFLLLLIFWKGSIFRLKNSFKRRPRLIKAYIYLCCISYYSSDINIHCNLKESTIFPHSLYGIFISKDAVIGEKCVVFQQVTIGSNTIKGSPHFGSPKIGNNVYIGTGAKIIGKVNIGNNVRIGANAVVVNDIPDNCVVVNEKVRVLTNNESLNNEFIQLI
jgi:serine O-acetyltransferase